MSNEFVIMKREVVEQVIDFLTVIDDEDDDKDFLSLRQYDELVTVLDKLSAALRQP